MYIWLYNHNIYLYAYTYMKSADLGNEHIIANPITRHFFLYQLMQSAMFMYTCIYMYICIHSFMYTDVVFTISTASDQPLDSLILQTYIYIYIHVYMCIYTYGYCVLYQLSYVCNAYDIIYLVLVRSITI